MPEDARNGGSRRSTAAWILYDLANTIFSFNILSVYYSLWVKDQFEDARLGDAAFAAGNIAAMAVVFLLAPALGALSDRARRRIPFLIASTLVCVLSTLPLGFLPWSASLVLFALANVGFQAGLIFYDALLAVVSTSENRGKIGALGVGVGYLGSLLGLGIGATLLALRLDDAWIFAATGLAFLLFAVPSFRFVVEPARKATRLSAHDVWTTGKASFAGLWSMLRGAEFPAVRRFLIGRVFYTDAANTMIIFMSIYATEEAGFTKTSVQGVLLLGILGAALSALPWGVLVDRAGPKRTLDVVLLCWAFGLLMVILMPILGLPGPVFYPLAFFLGACLAGTWSADRPLMLALAPAARLGEYYGYYSMVGRFAAILGPALWFLFVHPRMLNLGRPMAVLSLLVLIGIAFAILRSLREPVRTGPSLLGHFLPWRDDEGHPTPFPRRWGLRFPAQAIYLAATTSLFFALLQVYRRGTDHVIDVHRVPEFFRWAFVYEIPHLYSDPLRTLVNFVTTPWVNYHPVQLVYVWVLLLLFGIWFEIREGTKRTVTIFYATHIVAGVFAGVLLHVLRFFSDAAWIEDTWTRAWTGGSAGAFGLMGALAARARKPWLLMGLFLLWEINVEAWYLKSYTPAFHVSALALGYWLGRRIPPVPSNATQTPVRPSIEFRE